MKRDRELVGPWSRTRSRLGIDPVIIATMKAQAQFHDHLYEMLHGRVTLPMQAGSPYRWTNDGILGATSIRMGYIQAAMNAPINAGFPRNYVDADARGRPAVSVTDLWNLPYYRNITGLIDRTVVLSTMVNGVRRWWVSRADRGPLKEWTPMVMTDPVGGNPVPLRVRPYGDGYVPYRVNPAISRSRIRR